MLAHLAPFIVFYSIVGIVTVLLIVRALKRRTDPLHALREQILKHAGQEQGPDDGKAPLRSPFKDSAQIGIKATAVFSPKIFDHIYEGRFSKPDQQDKIVDLHDLVKVKALFLDDWQIVSLNKINAPLPQTAGQTRVYKAFKPNKIILTEIVTATFRGPQGDVDRIASVEDADDIVLVSAFAGADNCFPNAPTEDSGIAGPTFSMRALGTGVSWPTINAGIDASVSFAIERSVLNRVQAPEGYDPVPIRIEVKIRLMMLGPSLR